MKTLSRSFAGGEITPELFSRLDLDKFQTGLALCQNCETLPQGPVQNRAGYSYVLAAKYWDRAARLIPFSYSTEQTFAIEFGDQYVRFHTQGATLLETPLPIAGITLAGAGVFNVAGHGLAAGQTVVIADLPAMPEVNGRWFIVNTVPDADHFTLKDLWGTVLSTAGMPAYGGSDAKVARVYELATPYTSAALDSLNYVQSADVLTLVSPYFEPRELRRLSATSWELRTIQFAPVLAPPQGTTIPPTAITHEYAVSAVLSNFQITSLSAPATCSNDLTLPGYFNTLAWASVPGGVLYHVYKRIGGQWQWIGVAPSGSTVIDDGSYVPDPTAQVYQGPGGPGPVVSATAQAPVGTGVAVMPTGAGAIPYEYVVTSRDELEVEESIASTAAAGFNDLAITGNFNTVTWPAVPGVRNYGVYRKQNGLYAFVGRGGPDCVFVDRNVLPDSSITPPLQTNPFQGDGNYPRAVSYFEQRRMFGGTINQPQTVWGTRSATERNMGYSFPSRSDDALSARVVAREAQTIRHLVPMNDLMLLTSGGEWKMGATDSSALAPRNISIKPQGYAGSSSVPPVVTDRSILFAQDRGGTIRELQFSWQQQGYQTTNVSVLAPHLFDGFSVRQLAYTRSPLQALWTVRSDGALLGMTYVPEHEVRAWHQHQTAGAFESVCSVAEGDEDALYAVVRRTINGTTVRYIERRHNRRFAAAADQFFVDSGISYSGAPAQTFSGLHHLEGETVAILADAGVSPPQVVTGGKVTIDAPASKVHIGLPYRSRGQTLPMSMEVQALGQGMAKNINAAYLRVRHSNGFSTGPTFDSLVPMLTRGYEPYGSAPDLVTDEVSIVLPPLWQQGGQFCFQQEDPIAMTVLGITFDVATGS
jgi:hypothetical protein